MTTHPIETAQTATPLRTTLLENDEVLVVATSYPSGATLPLHTHRHPALSYVLAGGTLHTTDPAGAQATYELRAGEALWSAAAVAHSARNVGPTPIRIVEVEIKRATPRAAHAQARALRPVDLTWATDTFDPRRSSAALLGDTTEPGPYTVRMRAPAGYAISLHLHPDEDEQLTILSGAIRWSTGAPGSGAREHVLGAGGFAFAPAGTPHRIAVIEDAVIQMTGTGPRTYVYLDGVDPEC